MDQPAADKAISDKDTARRWFDRAVKLQSKGALPHALNAYRRIGPWLPELLMHQRPNGDPVGGPDFLIIGPPRAGTTWLKKTLALHPQVWMLSGEHHYFYNSAYRSPLTYVGSFANRHASYLKPQARIRSGLPAPGRALYGEKSPTYLTVPDLNIDLAAVLFPNARLIALVRDPVDRAWSHVQHLGLQDRADDLDYLRAQPPWNGLPALVEYGRYGRHLGRWAKRFSPEQILLIDFRRIASEPAAVLSEALAHIGAQEIQIPEELLGSMQAPSRSDPSPVLKRYLERIYAREVWDLPALKAAMRKAAQGGPKDKRSRRAARSDA